VQPGKRAIRNLAKKLVNLKAVLTQTKAPLMDVTAVNEMRWELSWDLKPNFLPIETASCGGTKFNGQSRLS
jgi:hypothetical protein